MATSTQTTTGHTKPHPSRPIQLAGQRLHFVGIGGCGMSGLARLAQQRGARCSGSDLHDSAIVTDLQKNAIHVTLEQQADGVPDPCDMLVTSAAIPPDQAQVVEADRRGVTIVKYAQLLGQLMVGRNGIAVAGTHGKSTTTSLLSHVLIQSGLDPSLIVGALCPQIGGGWRIGSSDLLVAEACEFDRSFCHLHPRHALILNIEEDHLDVYDGIEQIVEAFTTFAARVPADGSLLINHEMPHRLVVTAGLGCCVETIGFAPQADWQVQVIEDQTLPAPNASCLTQLLHQGRAVVQWHSHLPGEHMAYNAAAAAVTAHRLGAQWDQIARALGSFLGLERRMQLLGTRHDVSAASQVTIVDDYGHHPTEIDTTLRALRRHYHPKRLICVFQPHQHSRTRFLMEQFAVSFSAADIVIVPHIYFVRDSETERHAVRAADLVDRLRRQGKQAMHLYPFAAIIEQLDLIARDGDLVVTMGAGDVWQIAHGFLG